MRDAVATAMLRFLGDQSPHEFAGATLSFLANASGARSAALFDADEHRPRLVTATNLAQESLDAAMDLWKRNRPRLLRGDPVHRLDGSLVPLLRQGTLVGMVYLDSSGVNQEALFEAQPILSGAALYEKGLPPTPVQDFLERIPPEELLRDKLLLLLDRYDWNISRVAREMKMTRTTLYKKLETFSIQRRVGRDGRQRSAGFARRRKP